MTTKTKLTVAQFLAEWATLHPESKLNVQAKIGAKIAGIMNGAKGRTPEISHELFFNNVERHRQGGCNLKQALFNTAKELDCHPKSTEAEDDYRLLFQRYTRAKKALKSS